MEAPSNQKPPETHRELTEQIHAGEDFQVLNKDMSRKSYEHNGQMLAEYVERTDAMIGKMLHFETTEHGEKIPADVVIFLDKSARPLAWLARGLWDTVTEKDNDGNSPDMPDMKFLNIDRLPWRIDPNTEIGNDVTNFREPSELDTEGLRKIFTIPGIDGYEDGLNNSRVLVIDEVSDSGDTVYVAEKLLQAAYPSAKIKSHTWMNDYTVGPHGEKRVNNVPVWYKSDAAQGRGVYDPVEADHPAANQNQRLTDESHQFLSTRPSNHIESKSLTQENDGQLDPHGVRLRSEMAALALGVKRLELPDGAIPALDYHPANEEYLQKVRAYKGSLSK